jgi:hypothetical protein
MLIYGLTKFGGSTLRDSSGTDGACPNASAGLKILEFGSFGFFRSPDLNMGLMSLSASAALGSSRFWEDLPCGGLKSETFEPNGCGIIDLEILEDFPGFQVHLGWSG